MLRPLLRVPVPWVFVLAYLVGVALETATGRLTPSPKVDRLATIAGAVLFLIGAVLATWALALFRKARTTTIPGRVSAELVTWGPYRASRNPMYVALALAYLGEAALLKQIWPVVLLPLVLAYLDGTVVPLEETRLEEKFGEAYERYRTRVRRWL